MSKELNTSADPELQRRAERREAARLVLANALAEYIEAATDEAHYIGFQAGIDYGQEKLREFLKKPSPARNAFAHGHGPGWQFYCDNVVDIPASAGVPDRTAADIVRTALLAYPGLTGAQLYEKICDAGFQLNERTFRTALWRMKVPATEMPVPGHVVGQDNRWYLFENAPADVIARIRESRVKLHEMKKRRNGGQSEG